MDQQSIWGQFCFSQRTAEILILILPFSVASYGLPSLIGYCESNMRIQYFGMVEEHDAIVAAYREEFPPQLLLQKQPLDAFWCKSHVGQALLN